MFPRRTALLAGLSAATFLVASTRLSSHETVNTTVTFDREIVRILSKKCLACHSDQNLGIPLTSYEQTRPWARSIEEETLRRHMPPWRAVSGYSQFANDVGLTSRELQFVVGWVEGNGPKNKDEKLIVDIAAATPAEGRLKADFTKWPLGAPDLAVRTGSWSDDTPSTRRSIIALPLTSDRWVRAVAFQPEDRRYLAAASFTVQETGQWLGTWTPWYTSMALPDGTAYRLPAGSHVVAETVYWKTVPADEHGGTFALYFAGAAPSRSPVDLAITARPESGAAPNTLAGSATLTEDTKILALNPKVQAGLQSIEVTARTPDGGVRVLLLVRNPLPEWPTPYVFQTPASLPRGTRLVLTAHVGEAPAALTGLTMTASLTKAATP